MGQGHRRVGYPLRACQTSVLSLSPVLRQLVLEDNHRTRQMVLGRDLAIWVNSRFQQAMAVAMQVLKLAVRTHSSLPTTAGLKLHTGPQISLIVPWQTAEWVKLK